MVSEFDGQLVALPFENSPRASGIEIVGILRAEGLEPSRAFAQRILSPLRLPVPPRPHLDHV